jgi:5-methylcytosine-specific restriction endonuclease McrA
MASRGKGGNRGQGSRWIRKDKRWAIYLRDGMRCVYCGAHATQTVLTLDHCKPRKQGGSNDARNLVTCCYSCNSAKKNMSLRSWYRELEKKGADVAAIRAHVSRCRARRVPLKEARARLKTTKQRVAP